MEQPKIHPLKYEIDPRIYTTDNASLRLLAVWVSVCIGIIVITAYNEIWFMVWVMSAMLLTLFIYLFCNWNKTQALVVSKKGLIIHKNSQPIAGSLIKRGSVLNLVLDYGKDEDAISATPLLSISQTTNGYRRTYHFGFRLNKECLNSIYYELKDFLTQHGFKVEAYNYLEKK